jgi:hypothetical protein
MEGPLVSVNDENEALFLQNELQQQIAEQMASLQMVLEANDAAPSDELKEVRNRVWFLRYSSCI